MVRSGIFPMRADNLTRCTCELEDLAKLQEFFTFHITPVQSIATYAEESRIKKC